MHSNGSEARRYSIRTAYTRGSGATWYGICTSEAILGDWLTGLVLSPMFSLRLHHFLTLSMNAMEENGDGGEGENHLV